jgi:hypothetical protein
MSTVGIDRRAQQPSPLTEEYQEIVRKDTAGLFQLSGRPAVRPCGHLSNNDFIASGWHC